MTAYTREPTHRVRLLQGHDLDVRPVDAGEEFGTPVQLTDRLTRDLEKAHEALAKAELAIVKWLTVTKQDVDLTKPWG